MAPEELPLLTTTSDLFFSNGREIPRARRIDDRLGFGLAEVAVYVTPVALMIGNEAVKALIGEATKKSAGAVGKRARSAWRGWFRRGEADPESVPTLEERERIREHLVALAKERELSDEQADQVVDAVLRALPHEPRS